MSQLFVTDGLTRAVLRPAAWVTLVDEPRLFECVPLRIPHIDFSGNAILIRGGMGAGGRITVYLRSSKTPLQTPLKKVKITMIYTYVGSRGPPRIREHAAAAQEFFKATLKELDFVATSFTRLTQRSCDDAKFHEIIVALLPEPKKPQKAESNPGLLKAWENRVEEIRRARKKIAELRESGKGMQLEGSRGTFWGVLNAVLEFVDHHKEIKGSRLSYALMGDGMDLKVKAFQLIQREAAQAA